MENWLPSAIPKYFFELSVLHKTSMVKLAEETVSEWDRLLKTGSWKDDSWGHALPG